MRASILIILKMVITVASIGENLYAIFFSCIIDYTVDVTIFTALAKIKSGEIFMQYTSASFGKICLLRNISTIRYIILCNVLPSRTLIMYCLVLQVQPLSTSCYYAIIPVAT